MQVILKIQTLSLCLGPFFLSSFSSNFQPKVISGKWFVLPGLFCRWHFLSHILAMLGALWNKQHNFLHRLNFRCSFMSVSKARWCIRVLLLWTLIQLTKAFLGKRAKTKMWKKNVNEKGKMSVYHLQSRHQCGGTQKHSGPDGGALINKTWKRWVVVNWIVLDDNG